VLILIAAAALVAPLFVDWNSYRTQFEDYGRKLTGRDVTIAGGIEARLFPWPVLVLNQVKVANLNGTRRANFMEARRIEMGMSLAPLISGEIEVDTIAVDGPVFALERLPAGATSWTLEPEQSLAALIDPDRVAVSQISITNGTVFAGDHRRGGLARIDEFAGTLSAPALSGPWRLRATASHAGMPFEINLTTGKLRSGEPVRVGLRIAPVADAGVVYSFDGEIARPEGKSVKGALKITPTLSASGKGDAETGLRPFEVKADIEADYDTVALTEIEASPAFNFDPGNFITGAAEIDLGSRVVVRTALSTARLDLDQIAGRRGRDFMQSAGALEELGRFFAAVPEGLELHVDLAAASVIMGGQTLDASQLKLELSPERLSIDEFTTTFPGQTRTRFSGLLVFGEDKPLMSGDISVESVSLRDFVVWAVPEQKRAIERMWSGIRGRLMLDAKIDLAPQGVRLSGIRATLDGAPFTGSLSAQAGPDPGLALRFDADRVDLDRYLPQGFGQWSGESGLAMTMVDLFDRAMTVGDFQLTAQAGQLRFHGVEAQDIAIDIGANENGVELRTVEIGQVGAARMDVAGLLRLPGEGVAGSINAVIEAEDPRGLLRLFGAFGPIGGFEPAWAAALGPLDVKLIAEASAEDRTTTAAMALTGTAGGATASVEGTFRGERANWQDGEIELAGEMEARSSALVAAITGLELQPGPDRPTRLAGSLAGSLRGGLATSLEAELLGARSQFVGSIKEGRRTVEAAGRIAVLAEDAAELFALLGVPADELSPLTRVLAAESEVRYDGRGLQLSGLSGTAGRASFSGDLNLVAAPVQRVSGQITTDYLSLPWLLGAVLLPHDGNPHALTSHFASAVPGLQADLTIAADRLVMLPQIAIESSELDFKVGRYGLKLAGRGTGPDGKLATGRFNVELDSRGVAVEGAVEGPVALGALLRARDGRQVIDADGHVALKFSGSGRSPAGVLAALQADGSYELARGVLKRVDPETFARDLAAAKQPSEIDGLFTASLRSGDMAFVGGSGSLKLAEGVLQAKPLAILGHGITGEARFLLEAASGEVDLSFTLSLAELQNIPTFELAYAGSPRALEPSTDAQNLKSYLAMQMLQESVQQLEEVQRQERKLIEEEEKFQREQQRREELRREELRREAEQKLDRKERELAARRKIEERKAEERKAEERKAEERKVEEPKAEEPKAEERKVEERKVEERKPEPAAARSDAVTVLPLNTPPSQSAPGTPSDPAPLPRLKPEPGRDTASVESADPLQLPPDGNLGRIPEPVFSGPTILQPEVGGPNSGPAGLNR
jgi:hypothetical protein